MAGLVGLAALARLLAKRSATPPLPEPDTAEAEDPAAALRLRLAAQRAESPLVDEIPSTDAADEQREDETLEERRARIHAKAQQAIDAMREPSR